MPEEKKYLLKILSGPHQGAEVVLDKGDLVIGSDSECDLILSDVLIHPQHIKVTISDEGSILIAPLDLPVYLDGNEIKKQSYEINPFQFISLGTTHIVIGPATEDWPSISAADAPSLTKDKEEAKPTVGEDVTKEQLGKAASAANLEAEGEPEEPVVEIVPEQKIFGVSNKVFGAAVGGILLIAFAMAVIFLMPSNTKNDIPQAQSIENRTNAIKAILQDFDHEDDFIIRTDGDTGRITVEGWVDAREEKKDIELALMRLGGGISIRVWSQEKIMEDAQELINMLKVSVTIEPTADKGVYKAIGYVGDDKVWDNVRKNLSKDVAGIRYLQDEVITGKKAQAIANKVLSEYELDGKIDFFPMMDYIKVVGTISESSIDAWKAARVAVWEEMGYPVPMENQVMIASAGKVFFSTQIDSVNIGETGWIVVKGGEKVFTGGTLPGGFVVKSIGKEGIVLKRGDQQITIQPGGSL